MWTVNNQKLCMVEGDFGIQLPCEIKGTTLTEHDEIALVIKNKVNGQTILTKTYTGIAHNTFNLELTESESALLPVGNYSYSLDWYQNGTFMCNIIPIASFSVVEKA